MSNINVEDFLTENDLEFTLHEHPAVFTTEEAKIHTANIPGLDCKNLLLKDQKSKRFFLLVLPADVQADLKEFATTVGEKKLSFANSSNLMELLGLEPGSVSPFGLLNDQQKKVEVYIHSTVMNSDIVKFHPNRNTASLEISKQTFKKYLEVLQRPIHVI